MSVFFFPVALIGRPQYADFFGGGHPGTDIFAPEGTAVVAVEDGALHFDLDPKGGQVAFLATPSRTYYYAHLSRWEGMGRSARAGEVVGYVGTTGNAAGRPPHLHFGIYEGGKPRNPYPELAQVVPPEELPGLGVVPIPGGQPRASSPRRGGGGGAPGLGLLALAMGAAGSMRR